MGLLATTGPFKEKCNKQFNVVGSSLLYIKLYVGRVAADPIRRHGACQPHRLGDFSVTSLYKTLFHPHTVNASSRWRHEIRTIQLLD